MQELIDKHGLGAQVEITGLASSQEVKDHILTSRAVLLPSFSEGLPVVLMEAFALGRPVVSTYVGAIPELVQPGESGWLLPPGSVEAIVDSMLEVLASSGSRLEEMGRVGRTRIQDQFCAKTEALKLREHFLRSTSM